MAFTLTKKKNQGRGIVGLDLDGEFIAAVQMSADGISRAVSAELAARHHHRRRGDRRRRR